MSDPVGLARLPAGVSASLRACAAELAGCAGQLDAVLNLGVPALEEMGERRAGCGREVRELLAVIESSRRTGPDRARLAQLARSAGRTAEAVESVAWAWARHPIPELADLLRAQRDATRAVAKAVEALDDGKRRQGWEGRCRDREAEAAALARAARAALISTQGDVALAVAAHDTLTYAAGWLLTVAGMRSILLRWSLD